MSVLEGVRAGWGGMQLAFPDVVAGLCGLRLDRRARLTARVLGARQLGQAAFTATVPTADVRRLGVVVDGLHAASMVGLAVADTGRRRVALTDCAIATAFLLAGLIALTD